MRGHTPGCATPWLPETPSHRPLTLVWCRWRVEAPGKPLCTVPALAVLGGSANRPAARQPLADVRPWGEDGRAVGLRQRQREATVVAGVGPALLPTPWAGPAEWAPRVKAPLGRHELRAATSAGAVEPLACGPGRRVRRRQVETGPVQSHEAWRWTARLESQARPAAPSAGWSMPSADPGRRRAAPPALAALVTPDLPLAQVPGSLGGLPCLMTRCSGQVPRSVLGRGGGVPQTTV